MVDRERLATVIYCIVGLPGSGKTTYAEAQAKLDGGFVIDDITDVKDIDRAVDNGHKVIYITDVHLCVEHIRDLAFKTLLHKAQKIKFVYFKNDKDQCIANVKRRNDGRDVMNTIQNYATMYRPPSSARDVWSS